MTKVPKHEHIRDMIHPKTAKFVCWCEYPFCLVISELKQNAREVALVAIYEEIKKDTVQRFIKKIQPLTNFIKMR